MISKKYNEILRNLESHIFNKKDLDYIKKQITDLTICYIDELDRRSEKVNKKFNNIEKRLLDIENKIDLLENIDDDYFEDFNEEEIVSENGEMINCPYCNCSFCVQYDISNKETLCPKCDNLIVLDWGDFEDDM